MSNEFDDLAPAPVDDVSPDAAEAADQDEVEVVMEAEKSVPIHPGLRAAGEPVSFVAEDEDIPLGAGVSADWLKHVERPDTP